MSSGLKARVKKLEEAGTEATYPGIVIYHTNRVMEKDEDVNTMRIALNVVF